MRLLCSRTYPYPYPYPYPCPCTHLPSYSLPQVRLAMLGETPVAIKTLKKDGVAVALPEKQLQKLQRECSLMASVSHPNIVQVRDS